VPEPPADPARLAQWREVREQVGRLPPEERERFEPLYYQGLTQVDAADLLGVSVRTDQRRSQSARLSLHDRL
jgi:DNA-directed RNA polymerase specialized sigma24 family protein